MNPKIFFDELKRRNVRRSPSHMSPRARLWIVRRLTPRRKSRQRLRPRRRRH